MSTLITTEWQRNEPEEPGRKLPGVRSAGRAGTRPGNGLNPPHPPGPAGLNLPPVRLLIKHPPGPAGLHHRPARRLIEHPPGPAGLNRPPARRLIKHPPGPAGL
jgi:hypothetical protein